MIKIWCTHNLLHQKFAAVGRKTATSWPPPTLFNPRRHSLACSNFIQLHKATLTSAIKLTQDPL